MSNIIINAYTATPAWEYTADLSTETGWTKSGTQVGFSGGKMQFTGMTQGSTDYIGRLFPDGHVLSDTMWTQIGNAVNLQSGTTTPAPCFYGLCTDLVNFGDATATSCLSSLLNGAGAAPTNRAISKLSGDSGSVAYSLYYTGSRGTEYWTTLWRESATSSNFRVWSDSSRATNVFDSTFTINSGIISLDNMIGTGQSASVPSRNSTGYITELSWKDEVNVDS